MPDQPAYAFLCRSCGHCCRHADTALRNAGEAPAGSVLARAAASFPYPVLPGGQCSQLQPDNTCAQYKNRPLLCNVDALYDALALDNVSRAEWHEINAAFCPTK